MLLAESDAWVQNLRTGAVFILMLLVLWVARSVHFKFGSLEATVLKTEKQLNGRKEDDTTVSADVAEIRALVKTQAAQMVDVHANIVVGDGQREGMRKAMATHVAVVEQLSLRMLGTDLRVEALEQRNTAAQDAALAALDARVATVEEKLDQAS